MTNQIVIQSNQVAITRPAEIICSDALNIRATPDNDIRSAIVYVATNYTGADTSAFAPLVTDCMTMLRRQFGGYKFKEIQFAFELAAAGKLKGPKDSELSLTSFGGKFTVNMLGKVLAAYDDYRKDIIKQHLIDTARIEAEQEAEKAKLENEATRLKVLSDFDTMIERGLFFNSIIEVPMVWANTSILKDAKRISTMPDMWTKAREMAKDQLESEALSQAGTFDAREIRAAIQSEGDKLVIRAQALYVRLVINQTLIENANSTFICVEASDLGKERCKNQCQFCKSV